MDWEDNAIVLALQEYNSDMLLMSVMSEKHGLRKGLIKVSKSNKAALNTGNILKLKWYGRMENHLGKFSVQSCEIIAQYIYQKKHELLSLMSMCEIFKHCLPEKEEYTSLYLDFCDFPVQRIPYRGTF